MLNKNAKWTLVVIITLSVMLNLLAFTDSITKKSDDISVDEHILVEIYEVPEYENKGIHIHYGNENNEFVPFHDFDKTNQPKNGELIISTINRLERDGYDLTHVSSGLATNGMITKIFMVKRQDD